MYLIVKDFELDSSFSSSCISSLESGIFAVSEYIEESLPWSSVLEWGTLVASIFNVFPSLEAIISSLKLKKPVIVVNLTWKYISWFFDLSLYETIYKCVFNLLAGL